MPRTVRLEYPGEFYHVMARGDRGEAIVDDEEDRNMFLRTLGQACERTGFRVHAYVLMTNHYHLLLETPKANLSKGMGWMQNAFTRRINTRHQQWGHVFGGRYKAILAEPGNCFWALLDYIHLNPVRAGMTKERDGLESYLWSSLVHYINPPRKRVSWLETATGLEVCGCSDSATGRKDFLAILERRIDWRKPHEAGTIYSEGPDSPELAVSTSIRRGWFFGSERFREKLLKRLEKRDRPIRRENGYHGSQIRDHDEKRAQELINVGLKYFEIKKETLRKIRKGDWRKGLLAALVQNETTVSLDWISRQLNTGTRSGTCRIAAVARKNLDVDRGLKRHARRIREISTLNG